MYNILFVEAEYRKVLPLIRYAGMKGYSVYTISYHKFSIGGASKYVKKNYFFREFSVDAYLEIIDRHNIDIIIPCNDNSVEFFARNKERFEIPIVAPSIDQFEIFRDKLKTIRLAERLNIRVPRTYYYEDLWELLNEIKKTERFPLVVKPRKSSGSRGLFYVNSLSELKQVLTERYIEKYGYPMVQEYIPKEGEGIGASFLFYKGREVFHFCHKRIRQYPVDGGPSTFAVSIHEDKDVKMGKTLLEEVKWNGFAMVEFKRDIRTNELVLMEVNPRMWGTIGLAVFSGLDIIEMIRKVFIENANVDKIVSEYKDGRYFRWFFPGDLLSVILDKRISFKEKIKLLIPKKQENVFYQILDWKDLRPLIHTLLYSLFKGRG